MSKGVQITLAIPTYNRREVVCSLVEAIVPQLQAGDELLVVDDGSQDSTADALRAVPQVRLLVHDTNQGMVETWNTCLVSATRDWICIVHDDDTIAPDALATIRRACSIANEPALISLNEVGTNIDSRFRYSVLEPGPWAMLHYRGVPSGLTVHREIVATLGTFDKRFTYSTDLEYFPRISAQYKTIVIESPHVLNYNQHNSNYQYKTWQQPDFLDQLQEIEQLVMHYTGLSEAITMSWKRERWIAYITHMFYHSARINDKTVLRKTSQLLRRQSGITRRLRVYANIAAVFGWVPSWFRP